MIKLTILGNGYTAQALSKEALKKGFQVSIITRNISKPKKNIHYLNFYDSKNIENSAYYANFINSDDLRSMLYEYSSDKFMGREAGTKGQKLAVDYLKEKYRFLKISSAKKNGDYFQYVPLIAENTKSAEVKIENKLYKYFNDFIVKSAINGSKLINTDSYAYVGYGIKDLNYNDYSNIDVKN